MPRYYPNASLRDLSNNALAGNYGNSEYLKQRQTQQLQRTSRAGLSERSRELGIGCDREHATMPGSFHVFPGVAEQQGQQSHSYEWPSRDQVIGGGLGNAQNSMPFATTINKNANNHLLSYRSSNIITTVREQGKKTEGGGSLMVGDNANAGSGIGPISASLTSTNFLNENFNLSQTSISCYSEGCSVLDCCSEVADSQHHPPMMQFMMTSPQVDRFFAQKPLYCSEIAHEISEMFFRTENLEKNRINPHYLEHQLEVTEKMRAIVVDWLVDVCIKFKLHPETFYLSVNIMDRYLSVAKTTRAQLQLVGITALMLAAKYEEMWAPDIRECSKITANTYTRDEVLKMERDICIALAFRFTTPTPYVFLTRFLDVVTRADVLTRHAALFFLEHATMDYQLSKYLPSIIACAAMFLANYLIYISTSTVADVRMSAATTASSVRGFQASVSVDNITIGSNPYDTKNSQPFLNKIANSDISDSQGSCCTITSSLSGVSTPPSSSVLWPYELQYYSHATTSDIKPVAEELLSYCRQVGGAKYQAIRRKFSSSRWSEVSRLPLPERLPEDM